jgi:hypothetical protein
MANPDVQKYKDLAAQIEQQRGLPPGRLNSVLPVESSYNPNAVNPQSGAAGLGQLIPANVRAYGITNPYDPQQNLMGSANVMADAINYVPNNPDAQTAYYFHGHPGADRWVAGNPTPEERAYVQRVGYHGQPAQQAPQQAPAQPGSMMAFQMPNGKYYRYDPSQMSASDAEYMAAMQFPKAFRPAEPPKESTIGGAFMGAAKGLAQESWTGIRALWDPQGAAKEAQEEKEQREQEYGITPDWESVVNTYKTKGPFAATAQFMSNYVGHPLAENAPALALAMAGAAAGSAIPGLGTLIGGTLGGALALFPSMLSSNIERQVEKQIKDDPNVDPSIAMGPALAATLAQAGVNVATLRVAGSSFMNGFLKIAEKEGVPAAEAKLYQTAKASLDAQRKASITAAQTGKAAFAQGAAKGAAVMPMDMVFQTVVSRAQAGQDLLSQDALDEYKATLASATVVGGMFGGLAHFSEPARAKAFLSNLQDRMATQNQLFAAQEAPQVAMNQRLRQARGELPASLQSGVPGLTYSPEMLAAHFAPKPNYEEAQGPAPIPKTDDGTGFQMPTMGGTNTPEAVAGFAPRNFGYTTTVPRPFGEPPPKPTTPTGERDPLADMPTVRGKTKAEPPAQAAATLDQINQGQRASRYQPGENAVHIPYGTSWGFSNIEDLQGRVAAHNRLVSDWTSAIHEDTARQHAQIAEQYEQDYPWQPGMENSVAMDPQHAEWLRQTDELEAASIAHQIAEGRAQAQASPRSVPAGERLDTASRSAEALEAQLQDRNSRLSLVVEDPVKAARIRSAIESGTLSSELRAFFGGELDKMKADDVANMPKDKLLAALDARIAELQSRHQELLGNDTELTHPETGELTPKGVKAAQREIKLRELRDTRAAIAARAEKDPLVEAVSRALATQESRRKQNPLGATIEPSEVPTRAPIIKHPETGHVVIARYTPDPIMWAREQARRAGREIPDVVDDLYERANKLHLGEELKAESSPHAVHKEIERHFPVVVGSPTPPTEFGRKLGTAVGKEAGKGSSETLPWKRTKVQGEAENYHLGIQYGEGVGKLHEAAVTNLKANLLNLLMREAAERHAGQGGRLSRAQWEEAFNKHWPQLMEELGHASEANRVKIEGIVNALRSDAAPRPAPPNKKQIGPKGSILSHAQFAFGPKDLEGRRDALHERINNALHGVLPAETRKILEGVREQLRIGGSEPLIAKTNDALDHATGMPHLNEVAEQLRLEQQLHFDNPEQGQLFGEKALPSPFLARANAHQFQRFLNSKAAEEMRKAYMSLNDFKRLESNVRSIKRQIIGAEQHTDPLTTELSPWDKAFTKGEGYTTRTVGGYLEPLSNTLDALKGSLLEMFQSPLLRKPGELFTTDVDTHANMVHQLVQRRDQAAAMLRETMAHLQSRVQEMERKLQEAKKTTQATPHDELGKRAVQANREERRVLQEQHNRLMEMQRSIDALRPDIAMAADKAKRMAEEARFAAGRTSVRHTTGEERLSVPGEKGTPPREFMRPFSKTERIEGPAEDPFAGTKLGLEVPPPPHEELPEGSRVSSTEQKQTLEKRIAAARKRMEKADIPAIKAAHADKLKALEDELKAIRNAEVAPNYDAVRAGGVHGLPSDPLTTRADKGTGKRLGIKSVAGAEEQRAAKAPGAVEPAAPEATQAQKELNKAANLEQIKKSAKKGLTRMGDKPLTTPIDFEQAHSSVERAQEGLGDSAEIHHGRDGNDIPASWAEEMQAEGQDPHALKGWISADGKRVWLNNAMHGSAKDVEATLAHEIIGHRKAIPLVDAAWKDRGGFEGFARTLDGPMGGGVDALLKDLGIYDKYKDADLATKAKEAIAAMEERRVGEGFTDRIRRAWKELVGAVRQWLQNAGLHNFATANDYDIYNLLRQARNADHLRDVDLGGKGLTSKARTEGPQVDEEILHGAFGKPKDFFTKTSDSVKNLFGLTAKMNVFDRNAGLNALGEVARGSPSTTAAQKDLATQLNYDLTWNARSSMLVGLAVDHGILQKVKNTLNGQEVAGHVYEAKGPNLSQVLDILHKGNRDSQVFNLYLALKRAERVGDQILPGDVRERLAQGTAERQRILKEGDNDPVFQEARAAYGEYNKALLKLLLDTGYVSPQMIGTKDGLNWQLHPEDYVPMFRHDPAGELTVDFGALGSNPIRMGNIKDLPDLKRLLGGEDQLMDFTTGALMNTNALYRLGLGNQATRTAVEMLEALHLGTHLKEPGAKGADVIHYRTWDPSTGAQILKAFRVDGVGHTSRVGDIPAETIAKSLEGLPITVPAVVRAMAVPANWMRHLTLASPFYMARQLMKEPLAMWIGSGADHKILWDSTRMFLSTARQQFGGPENKRYTRALELGLASGGTLMGEAAVMARELNRRDPAMWRRVLANFEKAGIAADSAVRGSYLDQMLGKGMSVRDASLATAKNTVDMFQKGMSRSLGMLRQMVPFFSSQLAALDTLYKAGRGQLPFEERLQIQRKFMQRGALLAAGTIAYALMAKEMKFYQNASDDDKYGNWFIPFENPNDKSDPLVMRVPIPYEYAYLFKILPEAMVNRMAGDANNAEMLGAMKNMFLGSMPGIVPQAIKPVLEAWTNYNFFTGRPILSQEQEKQIKGEQYTPNTTWVARQAGQMLGDLGNVQGQSIGVSPIILEHFVKSLAGPLGLFGMQAASHAAGLLGAEVEQQRPNRNWSQLPLAGSMFQGSEGSRYLDIMEGTLAKVDAYKAEYDKMVKEHRFDDARDFLQNPEKARLMSMASLGNTWQQQDKELREMENQIRFAPGISPEQKQEQINRLQEQRARFAKSFGATYGASLSP